MNVSDSEWLRLYVEAGDQDAFTRLLARHVDLVYSAALRQTGEDPGAAEEVTQTVFADLARKSTHLVGHPCLAGWLYSSARLAAAEHRRMEGRRRIREARFAAMNEAVAQPTPPPEWNEIRPVLDAAMSELSDSDRDAVVLRFFEGQSHVEVGHRLGVSENTARMRVARALDKLRLALGRRGVVSAAEALGLVLECHAVSAAPVGLVSRIGPGVYKASVTPPRTFRRAFPTTAGVLVLAVAFVLMMTGGWKGRFPNRASSSEHLVGTVEAGSTSLAGGDSMDNGARGASGDVPNDAQSGSTADSAPDRFLILTIVAKDSGAPVPNVLLDHSVRTGPGPLGTISRQVATTRAGMAWIRVPTNALLMDLTTRTAGFADTRLRWEPPLGHRIPSNLVLHLERAVPLGGVVTDPDGHPVPEARVVIYAEPMGSQVLGTESHEFGAISATTDEQGKWSLNRVAEGMISRCRVTASHPAYQPAASILLGEDPEAEVTARRGQLVSRLTEGRILRGTVVDDLGNGIEEARVVVSQPVLREGITASDGVFELSGCPVTNHWIHVTAAGFAPARFPIRPPAPGELVRLGLKRAGVVRVRVLGAGGMPVTNAWFGFSVNPWETSPDPEFPAPPPIAGFVDHTNDEGRGQWTNAPLGVPKLDFMAEGYERRFSVPVPSDGLEHDIVLQREANLVVFGDVRNAESGQIIPAFRVALGYMILDAPVTAHVRFLDEERSWLRFEGGRFRHAFTDPLMRGTGDSRVVIKVEADGFQPWFSRPLEMEEGEVRMDVALKPSADFWVTFLLPDGRPAMGAEVGIVRAGDRLWLDGSRFTRTRGVDPASFRIADSLGRVRLSRDDGVRSVMCAHSKGFVRTTLDSLRDGSEVSLQPWSQIEVKFGGGDTDVQNAWVHQADIEGADLDLEFGMSMRSAGGQGRCLFSTIPPGEWDVSQVRPVVRSNGPTTSQPIKTTRVRLGEDETARVEFVENGYRVTGRIRLPAGFSAPPNAQWDGRLSWDHPDSPVPPREFLGNPEALARWREQPGIQEGIEAQKRRLRMFGVTRELSFIADSVEPGDYLLNLHLIKFPEPGDGAGVIHQVRHLLSVRKPVHIPSQPDSGILDLGWITAEIPSSREPE